MNSPDIHVMEVVLIGTSDREIASLEARLRAAQLSADVRGLDALISDALLFTGPDGQLASKAQDLAGHSSGVVRFCTHEPLELRVRRVGSDVAVTALCARLAIEVNGVLVHGTYRYTRVWARETPDQWRVVGGHVSEVPGEASGPEAHDASAA